MNFREWVNFHYRELDICNACIGEKICPECRFKKPLTKLYKMYKRQADHDKIILKKYGKYLGETL
jgi:hypothetical protein